MMFFKFGTQSDINWSTKLDNSASYEVRSEMDCSISIGPRNWTIQLRTKLVRTKFVLKWSGWCITVTPRTGSAVARYCPLWAWLHSHQPARFCSWELTEQLPRVVTHPGIALASNSLNFGVLTTPKPVSSQKASRYEDARCAI
ncbi:hypothetical protein L3X38_042482 [Prunus dulcis]|uniref:Uncharacterized protein n=1 Tax=Prunus dulcis TaxID=3755 RepID=A0AAD4UVA9_PRUDU|nr:hypothetical protein L3X38_042482 [Prunus dulcis]